MSECTHDCSTCSANCGERKEESLVKQPNPKSEIGKVYAIMSGKGGVGKSMVTSQLAVAMRRAGYRVGVLDADITGPSIPKSFGVTELSGTDGEALFPAISESGVEIMSINLLLDNEATPVVWRGPIVSGVVQQFWTDVVWHADYLFVDMPPGTGDVPLSVFQSIVPDGIIVVTSPQDLVSMVVEKAVNMAEMMHIPIVGLVENMSYFTCPDCGKKIAIYGEGKTDEAAAKHGLECLAKMPIDPKLAALTDAGRIEEFEGSWLDGVVKRLEEISAKDFEGDE